ncbi:hypothetical protein Asp14428_69540 [Actinoplanes sp. NBRC 14428]|nr:hypothetical protein Asp14428_69540 [Actinoplanes sp. NBRC 14428]
MTGDRRLAAGGWWLVTGDWRLVTGEAWDREGVRRGRLGGRACGAGRSSSRVRDAGRAGVDRAAGARPESEPDDRGTTGRSAAARAGPIRGRRVDRTQVAKRDGPRSEGWGSERPGQAERRLIRVGS